jgi:hypothetical protein
MMPLLPQSYSASLLAPKLLTIRSHSSYRVDTAPIMSRFWL